MHRLPTAITTTSNNEASSWSFKLLDGQVDYYSVLFANDRHNRKTSMVCKTFLAVSLPRSTFTDVTAVRRVNSIMN